MLKSFPEISDSILIATVLILVLCGFIILNLVLYYFRSRKHFEQQEKLRAEFAQTLLQSQLEIQEQTLQHVSKELHDNLGLQASLIKINLFNINHIDPAKDAEKIEETKELTRTLISDLKSLSVSLGGDRITQRGLLKALEAETDRINKTGQFKVNLLQEGIFPALDRDKAVILYRMSQEILNNMIKHSGAKHLLIDLRVSENLFILEFTDHGNGFDIEEKKQSSGAGLSNLENRAKLINAHLIIDSAPGRGTRVSIELPV